MILDDSTPAETLAGPLADREGRISDLLRKLTLDEKLSLMAGRSLWTTRAVERLGLASMKLADGPRGIAFHSSLRRCTAFPTGIALGATWDPDLAREFGEALAEEAISVGAQMVLGPAVNICRTPLNGRTFEYFTEDPHLASRLAVECVRGVQGRGVAACVKHYAANNQETHRARISAEVSERALREIYLPAFEAAVREADAWAVMTAYNAVNGTLCCENADLLRRKLFDEWGFRGLVVSDWFAARRASSGASAMRAGLTLEMPGKGSRYRDRNLKTEFEAGAFPVEELDASVRRHLRVHALTRASRAGKGSARRNTARHRALARRMAVESITLLKNDGDLLPLDPQRLRSLAVLGPFARKRHCYPLWGGSAGVWTPREVTPQQGIREHLAGRVEWVRRPEAADAAIVFLGTGHHIGGDSEGRDRPDMRLKARQEVLLRDTVRRNPNTVVVILAGGPVEMDWLDQVPAVVLAWYPGCEGGRAIADVLFGAASPSGKLPVTFPRALADSPAHANERRFPGDGKTVVYEEDVFVGYRHFDARQVAPLFPFGHGLSYTTFEYRDLRVAEEWRSGEELAVSFELVNTGDRPGAETAQLYISPLEPAVPRPPRELKAFRKVFLRPGERRGVELRLPPSAPARFCTDTDRWRVDPGEYELCISASSRDHRLRARVRHPGD